jgi:hypothetical protein
MTASPCLLGVLRRWWEMIPCRVLHTMNMQLTLVITHSVQDQIQSLITVQLMV